MYKRKKKHIFPVSFKEGYHNYMGKLLMCAKFDLFAYDDKLQVSTNFTVHAHMNIKITLKWYGDLWMSCHNLMHVDLLKAYVD